MRLLGISCDGNGVEVIAAILRHDAGEPGAVACETLVSSRRDGPASVSDCALELVGEVIDGLSRSLAPGQGFAPADLDALVFNAGPGGFTAVRSACAMVQGLALGWGKPVAALSSLEIWAEPLLRLPQAGASPALALVLLDARMGELYCGLFEVTQHLHCRAEAVLAPQTLGAWLQESGGDNSAPQRWLLGDFALAWPALATSLQAQGWTARPDLRLDGRSMLRQAFRSGTAAWQAAELVGPHYVRNKVALDSREQQGLRDLNAAAAAARRI